MDDFIFPEDLDDVDEEQGIDNPMEVGEGTASLTNPSGNSLPVGKDDEDEMKKLVREYKEVSEKTREIDELARQLAIGVNLQMEMDKCTSQRKDFALKVNLELRFLGTGSSLLLVNLKNTSEFVFNKWHLALVMEPLSTAHGKGCDDLKSYAKSIAVETLSKEKDFTCEVLSLDRSLVPLLIRPQWVKRFPLDDDVGMYRIELETIYFSYWDLISKPLQAFVPIQPSTDRAVVYRRENEEEKLSLPYMLVFLLCYEKPSEHELLKWLLRSVYDTEPSTNTESDVNIFEGILRDHENKEYPLRVEVKKEYKRYDVIVAVRSNTVRTELITQLQTRILVKSRYIYTELKSKEGIEEVMDISSVSKCFESYIGRFMT